MKILKILLYLVIILVVVLILVAGYFGLIPGVSTLFGSDKPRDLGVTTSSELYNTANSKIAVTRSGDATTASKLSYEGSHAVDISMTSEEISSLVEKGQWKYNPVSDSFKVKVNTNGTVEVAGLLNRTKLDGYLSATGYTEALKYTKTLNFLPEKVPFYLNGTASVTNNKVTMNLSSAQIGRVPLPTDSVSVGAVKSFVERRISSVPGLNVASFDFSNGKINFKGTYPNKISY